MIFKIFERYFLKEYLKIFTLTLFCLFALYVAIDYSSKSQTHYFTKLNFRELFQIYIYTFIQRLDILIPFALLVATVKTLTTFNIRNELVALLASGVAMKRLLSPLIFVGLFCTIILYLNEEFFVPEAMSTISFLKDKYQPDKEMDSPLKKIGSLETNNEGLFIYHGFDAHREAFYDTFWVRSADEFYRIKFLQPKTEPPKGRFVDYFKRNNDGEMILVESFDDKSFSDLSFSPVQLSQSMIQPLHEKVSTLLLTMNELPESSELKQATITALIYKLIMPLLCLFAVLAPAPYCLQFSRQLPIFMIYLVSMVVMVTFYLIMNAGLIVGESGAMSPFLSLLLPFLLYASFFSWKYSKI